MGLNNGYQNQNGERSGGGSKWGNSSKLGEVQHWVENVVNESFIISQITDCPTVEVEVDHTTGLIQSAVGQAGVTVASNPRVGSTATLGPSGNQPGWRLFPPVDL